MLHKKKKNVGPSYMHKIGSYKIGKFTSISENPPRDLTKPEFIKLQAAAQQCCCLVFAFHKKAYKPQCYS